MLQYLEFPEIKRNQHRRLRKAQQNKKRMVSVVSSKSSGKRFKEELFPSSNWSKDRRKAQALHTLLLRRKKKWKRKIEFVWLGNDNSTH